MSSTIEIRGLASASAETRAAVHAGVLLGLEALGVEGKRQVVENTTQPYDGMPPAVASGNFVNAIDFTVTADSIMSRMLVFAGAPADVYADPLNYGSRPHLPPINALLPWVKQKFGVEDEKAALSLAWAVAKSIEKKGVRGRQMFDRVQVDLEPKAPSILERAIADALRAAGIGGVSAAS